VQFQEKFDRCVACNGRNIYEWRTKDTIFIICRCHDCGTGFMNPPPEPSALADIYARSGHGLTAPVSLQDLLDAERRFPNSMLDAQRITSMARRLDASSRRRALDVGAGFGFYTKELRTSGYDVTSLNTGEFENVAFRELNGVDPLPLMLDEFEPGDRFGVVLLSQVLEHIPRPLSAVTKVARMLEPGGVFACAVPNFRSWRVRLVGVRDRACLWVPEHVNYFTLKGLSLLLQRADFHVVASEHTTRIPPDGIARRLPAAVPRRPLTAAVKWGQRPFCATVDRLGMGTYMTVYSKAAR
jgi:SAM-dependent methyltransferase